MSDRSKLQHVTAHEARHWPKIRKLESLSDEANYALSLIKECLPPTITYAFKVEREMDAGKVIRDCFDMAQEAFEEARKRGLVLACSGPAAAPPEYPLNEYWQQKEQELAGDATPAVGSASPDSDTDDTGIVTVDDEGNESSIATVQQFANLWQHEADIWPAKHDVFLPDGSKYRLLIRHIDGTVLAKWAYDSPGTIGQLLTHRYPQVFMRFHVEETPALKEAWDKEAWRMPANLCRSRGAHRSGDDEDRPDNYADIWEHNGRFRVVVRERGKVVEMRTFCSRELASRITEANYPNANRRYSNIAHCVDRNNRMWEWNLWTELADSSHKLAPGKVQDGKVQVTEFTGEIWEHTSGVRLIVWRQFHGFVWRDSFVCSEDAERAFFEKFPENSSCCYPEKSVWPMCDDAFETPAAGSASPVDPDYSRECDDCGDKDCECPAPAVSQPSADTCNGDNCGENCCSDRPADPDYYLRDCDRPPLLPANPDYETKYHADIFCMGSFVAAIVRDASDEVVWMYRTTNRKSLERLVTTAFPSDLHIRHWDPQEDTRKLSLLWEKVMREGMSPADRNFANVLEQSQPDWQPAKLLVPDGEGGIVPAPAKPESVITGKHCIHIWPHDDYYRCMVCGFDKVLLTSSGTKPHAMEEHLRRHYPDATVRVYLDPLDSQADVLNYLWEAEWQPLKD